MDNLKLISTAELIAIKQFSDQQLAFWNGTTDIKVSKYYKLISESLHNEIGDRLSVIFPELNYLIS